LYSAQRDKDCLHPTTQSGPDSQTARSQARNNASGCNAALSLIIILVLKSERLMRVLVNPLILFQTTPGGVFAVPQQIAMDVGHFFQDADLIVVEIGEVLSFVLVVVEDLG